MAKTLRVRTRTGWVTKPSADVPENRLIAEEVDDNFLALEQAIIDKKLFEVGYTMLAPRKAVMAGWLPMDGTKYTNTEYPDLGALVGGVDDLATELTVSASPLSGSGRSIATSPGGKYIAAGTTNGLYIIDADTLELVSGTPTVSDAVMAACFSPDGVYLAILSTVAPTLRVYYVSDWTGVPGIPTANVGTSVRACDFSPDSGYLAICGLFGDHYQVFSTADWSEVTTPATLGQSHDVEFSPDGGHIALCSIQEGLQILDTSTWTFVSGVAQPSTEPRESVFSPDGSLLYVVYGSTVDVYSTADWTVSSTLLNDAPADFDRIDVNYDGTQLVAARMLPGDSTVHVYDTVTGASLWSQALAADANDAEFQDERRQIVIVDAATPANLRVFDTQSQTEFSVPLVEAPRYDFEWRIKAE